MNIKLNKLDSQSGSDKSVDLVADKNYGREERLN